MIEPPPLAPRAPDRDGDTATRVPPAFYRDDEPPIPPPDDPHRREWPRGGGGEEGLPAWLAYGLPALLVAAAVLHVALILVVLDLHGAAS